MAEKATLYNIADTFLVYKYKKMRKKRKDKNAKEEEAIKDTKKKDTKKEKRLDFEYISQMLLPDIYDEFIVDTTITTCITLTAPEKTQILHGNYRDGNPGTTKDSNSYRGVERMRELQEALLSNSIIRYKDGGEVHCRDNMLNKIRILVHQYGIQAIRDKFQYLVILNFQNDDLRKKIKTIIEQLMDYGTVESCTYSIFLLILTSIYRDRIIWFEELYNESTINMIKCKSAGIQLLPKGHRFFADPDYKGTFNVYMFRTPIKEEDHLYNAGKLILNCDILTSSPSAQLTLDDDFEGDGISHCYEGVPLISDNMVYVIMGDNKPKANGSPGILTFPYEHFINGEGMYFRLALFISKPVDSKVPSVQKLVITKKDLPEDIKEIVMGILRTNDDLIFLSEEEIKEFRAKYADSDEVRIFDEIFEKKLEKTDTRWISESDILMHRVTRNISKESLIRIAYLLRNLSDSKWNGKDICVDTRVDPDLHRLMR